MKIKIFPLGLVVLFFSLNALTYGTYVDSAVNVRNSMFADVDLKHENYDAIYYLKNTGVINGYENKNSVIANYDPDKSINRAEFLKVIMEGNDIEPVVEDKSCFPDVAGGEWYTKYVCKAKEEGWIKGYPDGKFRPEQTINEVESLKILGEVLGWEKPQLSEDAEWYEYYLHPAKEKKITPQEDINAKMTRGDIAELVYRNSMVVELGVPYYDPAFEPNLFAAQNIPFNGPLAPGGLLGPGGPMGPSGAFVEGGAFDDQNGKVKLVSESYFEDNFCYFSDEGEFSGDNLNFLKNHTKEDLDNYVDSALLDEFGQMFCYSGIAATHLMLFDEKMREDFDILCWTQPDGATKEKDGWDEILCWAREKDKLDAPSIGGSGMVEIEVIDVPDFATMYDAKEVEVLRFKLKTDQEEGQSVTGLDLQSYGENDPYVMRKLTVKDSNGNIYFTGPVYMTDWYKQILTLKFDDPVMVNPGQEIFLSVYADLDWEDYNGNLQIGFANAILSNKAISVIGESVLGAVIGLEKEMEDDDSDYPMCNLSPEGKTTIGGDKEPPDVVEVNEDMHLVTPIYQQGETCAAASAYSSLRWLEEKLGIDYLVKDGQKGYEDLIKVFYEDTWTLTGQYTGFNKYIKDNFKGCLKANYNTNPWGGAPLTCDELNRYYDNECDIQLGIRCTDPGDWISWGHSVDIVDVQVDADDSSKCQIIFANSQTPNTGETVGPDDPDGLGYGSYQRGDYDENQNKFDIKAPWGKGLPCTIYGATYVCVEDEEFCRNNPNIIQLPEEPEEE